MANKARERDKKHREKPPRRQEVRINERLFSKLRLRQQPDNQTTRAFARLLLTAFAKPTTFSTLVNYFTAFAFATTVNYQTLVLYLTAFALNCGFFYRCRFCNSFLLFDTSLFLDTSRITLKNTAFSAFSAYFALFFATFWVFSDHFWLFLTTNFGLLIMLTSHNNQFPHI